MVNGFPSFCFSLTHTLSCQALRSVRFLHQRKILRHTISQYDILTAHFLTDDSVCGQETLSAFHSLGIISCQHNRLDELAGDYRWLNWVA